MTKYVLLMRGINVGGKNKVSMAALKKSLEDLGYGNVSTLLASGNVVADSSKSAAAIQTEIEKVLPKTFKLDSDLIKVLALSKAKFKSMLASKPKGFGEQASKYHSDAIFLMGLTPAKAFAVFDPKEGIDEVWRGKAMIFHQRLSAKRTKSRLSKIVASPLYKSMTVRSWQTTEKLLALLDA